MKRVIITGAAGLIGQNLVVKLKTRKDIDLLCFDKHKANCEIFRKFHPNVKLIEVDLSEDGNWKSEFKDADIIIMNHAQIGSTDRQDFINNNIYASEQIIDATKKHKVPYMIHISSSVVNSKAEDDYSWSKSVQEKMVIDSKIPYVILRPTLMFGWFDRKHIGWLARFMKKIPIFPIPNFGKYIRQPLYAGDFCNVIISNIDSPKIGEKFDISGSEHIYYRDLMKLVRKKAQAKVIFVYIPYHLFWILLKIYSFLSANPPFTTSQLEALVIPEKFPIIDWPEIFGVKATPTSEALEQTFKDENYSKIVLEF